MSVLYSFPWLKVILFYVYVKICLSTLGHLSYFHYLVIVNSAPTKLRVYLLVWIPVFDYLGHIPRRRTAVLYGNFIIWRNCQIVFHSGYTILPVFIYTHHIIPTSKVWGLQFLHILISICFPFLKTKQNKTAIAIVVSLPVFVNKVLLGHSYAYSFTCGSFCYNGRNCMAPIPKIFTLWLLEKKFAELFF